MTSTNTNTNIDALSAEFELTLADYNQLTGSPLAFADACCDDNTVAELSAALRDGTAHWTCAADCEAWGLTPADWLASIRGALAFKLARQQAAL